MMRTLFLVFVLTVPSIAAPTPSTLPVSSALAWGGSSMTSETMLARRGGSRGGGWSGSRSRSSGFFSSSSRSGSYGHQGYSSSPLSSAQRSSYSRLPWYTRMWYTLKGFMLSSFMGIGSLILIAVAFLFLKSRFSG